MTENNDSAEFVVTALREFSARKMAEMMLNITANLINTTPVDTGWARSNWVPSVGAAFGDIAGSRGSVSGGEQATGEAEMASYLDFAQGDLFITNNVPYILPLNDGHSAQAPAAFVQAAIEQGIASVSA